MLRFDKRVLAPVALAFLALACNDGGDRGMGPGMMGVGPSGVPASGSAYGAALVSVSPQGGAVGVSRSPSIMLRFSGPMGAGMERYVDLHLGDLAGPIVAMGCSFSGDRTTLTCTPVTPLQARTVYTLHAGGGMFDASGRLVDMSQYYGMMGGQWIMGGASHGGLSWGMMGGSWMGPNGGYGMTFAFTTE